MDYKEKTLTTPKHCDIIKETSVSQTENDTFTVEETPSDSYDMLDLFDAYSLQEETQVEFSGKNEIILYTALNKTNAALLKAGKLEKPIKAFEYSNLAVGVDEQAEVIVQISYDTKSLFDTLHPKAYELIEKHIKNKKADKNKITDRALVFEILKNKKFTGVRVHGISTSDKAYKNTNCIYKSIGLRYYLNPLSVKYIDEKPISEKK